MRLSVDEAFRKYGDRLFATAFSVCRNRADADDVVQNTFIKYHRLDLDYASEEHLRAWLLRVAVNGAKDVNASFWRRNKVSWEDHMQELTFQEPEDSFAVILTLVAPVPDQYTRA